MDDLALGFLIVAGISIIILVVATWIWMMK